MRRLLLILLICLTAIPAAHAQEEARVTGHFILSDMNGRLVSDESYRGKVRLVTFGYTFCPDICPTTLNTLSATLDLLGADRAKVAVLFVSVDPERDTPAHLKEYLNAFPDITGLSGTTEQVAAAARNFKVRFERQKPEGADPNVYSVDHSANIYIMDREGNFLARLPHLAAPDRVAERVRSYLTPRKAEN
ncbi:Cytochrome oxidase biogenesis protein Sco1/SenC/PrrC putative copper metallochaperone [Paramagnetospirillum magnetotacticum MS-1]|uniref:Cytochrome oxidase biogenesis protein Sco1/SenC/PrrC putative copper metallochaperone n=1 Tax=Paramagnetospirillum magnetotacticum MS-1 TaxID=272627 RepID=A0A0C2YK01_PARME|nr:SCO family protein [Paramagnetospirillum magnetotacticum]KIM00075.1 Cytochrome oxidase biogenesis protein Sco1/SenC/PrrC putative copper metallochaperone [Paramagnetospirillum magnetotacticum MS-1]